MLKKPKEKGRRLELYIAELLRGYGFKDAYRQPLSGGIDFLKGDINSKSFPLFVEVKNCEKTKFAEWYHKAELECGAKPPVIVWSRNREQIFAFLLFSDLLTLIIGGYPVKNKKPEKTKKLSLQETSNLKFSKLKMNGKKKATIINN